MWLRRDEQVASALRELIASGEWGNHLPGYRKLEQRLKVDRETIWKALHKLEAEGWVAPSEPGKRRRILRRGRQKETVESRILLVVGPRPVNDFSPTYRSLFSDLFQKAESRGWHVIYTHFAFDFPRRSVTALRREVVNHAPSRVLLVSPTVPLVKWMTETPLPTFALGGELDPYRDRINGCGFSFGGMVCAAATLLRNKGHQRLLIPMVTGKTMLRELTIARSVEGWARDIPRVELEAMFPEQGEWLPDVLRGFWPKQFATLKPTAVIVKESNELLSLLSYCHRKGIQIPADLSVVQLAGDASNLWLDPVPDRFEFPNAALCRKILQWMEKPPARPTGFETMENSYVPGGSVAAPAKSAR